MKKTATLLSLLALSVTCMAQTYIPFPSSNTLWTIRHGNDEAAPSFFCYGLKNGDTVLGTNNYHKLYRSDDAILDESEFCGGLREDGARRIYYYDAATANEKLLFDFNVTPGDTVATVPGPGAIVDYMDSVNINGTFHRRINFKTFAGTPWTLGSWIDGIGNDNVGGLMYSPLAQPSCDCGEKLVCFQNSGVWVFHNTASVDDCFGSPVSVSTVTGSTAAILYPVPVVGTSYIHIDGNKSYSKCVIYNISGAVLTTYDVSGRSDIPIEKGNLSAGIYYYQLSGKDGVVTEKFAVQ